MKSPWKVYAAMALLAAVTVGAMAYVTQRAISLGRRQQEAQRFASEQEKVRLALWRMDAAGMALLAAQSRHPLQQYQPTMMVTQSGLAAATYPQNMRAVEVLSPLLLDRGAMVWLHFVYDGNTGLWSSPQVPDGQVTAQGLLEEPLPRLPADRLKEDRRRLEQLRLQLDPGLLVARLRTDDPRITQAHQYRLASTMDAQSAMNTVELSNRAFASGNSERLVPRVSEGATLAMWQKGCLLLVRGRGQGRQMQIAGAWLDWPAVQAMLLSQVRDLVPEGKLEAIENAPDPVDASRLASLPLRLAPGAVPVEAVQSPVLTGPLAAAWACLLAALIAGAAVLRGVVSLGERRRAFVSAVTHELRTPLTTFRLYAEMLAEGMVTDEGKRQDYLQKLRDESQRLGHLVENVLAYSRLSGPRRGPSRQRVTLGELVEHARQPLEDLARRAMMELVIEPWASGRDATCDSPSAAVLETDVAAVEQILVNLVDNACKYAHETGDRRIRIQLLREGPWGVVRLRDGGPGIPSWQRSRLFRDFDRSAAEAAGNPPGVGLGLAISRRLARQMRGDLRYEGTDGGACFSLRLPVVT